MARRGGARLPARALYLSRGAAAGTADRLGLRARLLAAGADAAARCAGCRRPRGTSGSAAARGADGGWPGTRATGSGVAAQRAVRPRALGESAGARAPGRRRVAAADAPG